MACCIFAAFLVAQLVATLRRWGMFWGLVSVPEGEDADTFRRRLVAWLARPRVRRVAVAVLAAELAGFGSWVYAEHGEHLAGIAANVLGTAAPAAAGDADLCAGGADAATVARLAAVADPLDRQ